MSADKSATKDIDGLIARLRMRQVYGLAGMPKQPDALCEEAADALREQRDEIARLTNERGTLLCAGTTLKPEYTPLGQIILDLEKRAERAETRVKQLEIGYDTLRTALHRAEAELARLKAESKK